MYRLIIIFFLISIMIFLYYSKYLEVSNGNTGINNGNTGINNGNTGINNRNKKNVKS
jgi:hypothetical protein